MDERQPMPDTQMNRRKGTRHHGGMPPQGQMPEEVHAIMPDFKTLRTVLFRLEYAIVLVVFLVECCFNAYAYAVGLRESSILMACVLHILIPTGINLLIILLTNLAKRRLPEEDMRQNMFPVVSMLLICIAISLMHCHHTTIISILCLPIAATTLFSNKGMCRGVTGACLAGGILSTALHYAVEEDATLRLWLIPDSVMAMCTLFFVSMIAQTLLTMTDGQKNKLLVYARSIKEEKQRAEAASVAKSAFLANMSHEIRTPINAILGMNEMILRENKDEQIAEYARNVHTAGNSLLYLVNDVLDISKIESGKLEIVDTNYDTASFIHDCYNMIAEKTEKKGLELKIECQPSVPAQMRGDEVRLRQIVTNLLSNAAKYTEKGSIMLAVDSRREQNQFLLVIKVKDTGIGIKEENIGTLFTQFVRFDLEKNRNIEGTGLGLAITKQLVTLMKGDIKVDSIYGVGSCFTVTVPQQVIDETPIGDFHQRYRDMNWDNSVCRQKIDAPGARVLVVDDVEVNLKVMVNLLKATRIQVDVAHSGMQCISMAEQNLYDVIFLDHMMPEMDGMETFARMRGMESFINRSTPVIMLTANAISGVREQYLQAGFADYLSKPVSGDKLENMLLKYLPKSKIKQAVPASPEKPESKAAVESEAEETAVADGVCEELQKLVKLYPGVDIARGLSTCGDSVEMYIEIAQSFCEDSKLEELKEYYGRRDAKNYQILAHGTKSAALSIGFSGLSKSAKALEDAAKEEDWDYIDGNHSAFIAEYQRALEAIAQAF